MNPVPGDDARAVNNSVTGRTFGHIVQARDIHGGIAFHQHVHEQPPVEFPLRFGRVPPRADGFVGREVATDLVRALDGTGAAVLTSHAATTGVLSGLGGVGKTQLAVDHMERMWAAGVLDLVVWVTATSREAVVGDFARIAARLTGQEDADSEVGAGRLLDWLASTRRRWLVVLDDLRVPGDLSGLWPSATPTGRVLVTTRRRDAALRGSGRQLIDIGLFTPEESLAYLTGKLADRPRSAEGAAELADALGHLPLALAQAAAYLLDRGMTCAQYLDRFLDRRRDFATLLPEPGALPDEHRDTVAVTWSLSIELADRLAPEGLARPLLDLACLLDPNGIPTAVFTSSAVLEHLSAAVRPPASGLGRLKTLFSRGAAPAVDAERALDGLGCLHRLNLVTVDLAVPHLGVRVHALVQRATRDRLADRDLSTLGRAAAMALWEVWPRDGGRADLVAALRANTNVLEQTAEDSLWWPYSHAVMIDAGDSLGRSGQAAAATAYYRRLCDTAERHYGVGHSNTWVFRNRLAEWLGETGDAAGALAIAEQLVADAEATPGADPDAVLDFRHGLARRRGDAGDVRGAIALLGDVLAEAARMRGHRDPSVLAIRTGLARLRGTGGDAVGAVAALRELLPEAEEVLGTADLRTTAMRGTLAYWQAQVGEVSQAVAAYAELVEVHSRQSGPDHPDTLMARGNLAHRRAQLGEVGAAVTEFEALLEDCLRALGADDPVTLGTRNNLAYWRGAAGDPARAAQEFGDLLQDRLRVNGPDHPATLTARYNLVRWRGEAGDPGALPDLRSLLADQVRVFGEDHPDVQRTRERLDLWGGTDPGSTAR
ncbi:tetratricopeptide repeat protein [Saccharopolyspora indica]|uniref:tetratricopeptide repeat protein n=1 Tax=Saccharopolyspora indica TaxID=1229659 RepID=UPI0022EB8131|nr:tetratricopeptide repeat protein [Saccharopolyspora indica]MDA3645427.1 tetratricopeptide repeat protein [Saccharopolyspora indica]